MKKLLLVIVLLLVSLSACRPVDLAAPVPVYDRGIASGGWALIPAGEFLSGQFNHPAAIPYNYEIMITDVTNEQYARFLNEAVLQQAARVEVDAVLGYYPGDVFRQGRHEQPIEPGDHAYIPLSDGALRLEFDGKTFSPKASWADHPMTMVSWFGARAYCAYYGWRLPTELEWEKAARGTDGRPFPWGETISRQNANLISSRDPFEDMSGPGSRTTPVGFYNGKQYDGYQTIDSPSPYGLYDMAGNVWQWTGDIYPNQHYRYLRGGSKDNYENNLRVWARNSATPEYVSPAAGFRCAREAASK